jgi:hypothetical protein
MAQPRKRVRPQAARKRSSGKCFFCPCSTYEALQCHRIVPGCEGGTYDPRNTLVLCSNHHALVTTGLIKVLARRYGTGGSYIHAVVEGKEVFLKE